MKEIRNEKNWKDVSCRSYRGIDEPVRRGAATIPETLEKADQVMAETGLKKGDPNLLVLTNAGYGAINGESTEVLLDMDRRRFPSPDHGCITRVNPFTGRLEKGCIGFDGWKDFLGDQHKSHMRGRRPSGDLQHDRRKIIRIFNGHGRENSGGIFQR
jgi:hypothetical protein